MNICVCVCVVWPSNICLVPVCVFPSFPMTRRWLVAFALTSRSFIQSSTPTWELAIAHGLLVVYNIGPMNILISLYCFVKIFALVLYLTFGGMGLIANRVFGMSGRRDWQARELDSVGVGVYRPIYIYIVTQDTITKKWWYSIKIQWTIKDSNSHTWTSNNNLKKKQKNL